LKVAISYSSGYRAVGRMLVSGPDVLRKAEKAAEIFWQAAGGVGSYDQVATQFIGWDASHPPLASDEPGEVLMQVAVRDMDRAKIERSFAPTVVGRMLGSVPGFTMPGDQGRPRASEVVGHWPALIDRARVTSWVALGDRVEEVPTAVAGASSDPGPRVVDAKDSRSELGGPEPSDLDGPSAVVLAGVDMVTVPLIRLCIARSGDKGDTANIGVIGRTPAIYWWMVEHLTVEMVKQHFKDICQGEVERFKVANLSALNFLLHESLGGGGTLSLRFDAQGKTYAQYLLAMKVEVPVAVLASVE
jgi:hypothetical protein